MQTTSRMANAIVETIVPTLLELLYIDSIIKLHMHEQNVNARCRIMLTIMMQVLPSLVFLVATEMLAFPTILP